jgi:predicted nucleotidyltransferase
MSVEEIKEKVKPVLAKNGIKKAGLFGSIVRNEQKSGSDIDILIKLEKDISLLDFVGIKLELEDALGMKVDLVEYDAIKPALKDYIMKEEVPIY